MQYFNRITLQLYLLISVLSLPIILIAQNKKLTELEKKTLSANTLKVIAEVSNDFRNIAIGETKTWGQKKISRGNLPLLPPYTKENEYLICYGMDDLVKTAQHNYYEDLLPFGIAEINDAIAPGLKAIGFIEVQPQRLKFIDTARAYRRKDAVVVISGAKDILDKNTTIQIGKFFFYQYGSVLPVTQITKKEPDPNYFSYEHPCGLKASGRRISADSLFEGTIRFCYGLNNTSTIFTGIYKNYGFPPRSDPGNINGIQPIRLQPNRGQLSLVNWSAIFSGDFYKADLSNSIIATGWLKINSDSVYGYLHYNSNVQPVYLFTPHDRSKKRINFYSHYQGRETAQVVYDKTSILEEEQERVMIEERNKNRQNKDGERGGPTVTPAEAWRIDAATIARIKLYEWLRREDGAREVDIKQCIKDRGYGVAVARMSGHCKRVEKYIGEIIEKCNSYLKEHEKYTPANHVSDIKERIKAAGEGLTGLR